MVSLVLNSTFEKQHGRLQISCCASKRKHTHTPLYYLCEDMDIIHSTMPHLTPNQNFNLTLTETTRILTSTPTKSQTGLKRCEDQPKCLHFSKMSSPRQQNAYSATLYVPCVRILLHTHTDMMEQQPELIYLFSLLISVFSSKSRALMEDCSLSQGATTERVMPLITSTLMPDSGDNHRDLQWLAAEDGCSRASCWTVDRTRSIHS